MTRVPLWKEIADQILRDITAGQSAAGAKLPTEAEFAERFGVNRHTVRQAISALVDDGIVYTRRGSGTFVASKPVRYSVGKRVRFHQSISASGHDADKRILNLSTRPADAEERRALDLLKSAQVHVAEGLGYIDRVPVTHFLSVFPADRLPDMLTQLAGNSSVTDAFRACGISDYTRKSTRLTAVAANSTTAAHLNLKPGGALLRSIGINVDPSGTPIEYGKTWFSGRRVELTIDG
jgi:GntR family phosphonate transport system transcriptional regulator